MNKSTKAVVISFFLGMLVMFVADIYFHFNNSVEAKLEKELKKTERKIEELFK